MKYLLSYDESSDKVTLYKDHFKELSDELSKTKAMIDKCPKDWELCKKMIHSHEYVYSSSYQRKNICGFAPVSRSYFKMKEMKQVYLPNIQSCVCLAEAPGGFIQCILETEIPTIYGITLISGNHKVPFWNRILTGDDRFEDFRGIKNNGDLIDFTNVLSIIKKFGRNSVDLVTGDGGFDNSDDYNHQELNSLPLIYSEIYLALQIQREGGTFICKLFDTFVKETVILIYILTLCYEKVYLHKPLMSRVSNSEKYIVCLGFSGASVDLMNQLTHHFNDNLIDIPVNSAFLKRLSEFNELYTREQSKSIQGGVELIKQRKLMYRPTQDQVRVGLSWCKTYDMPVNPQCQYL